MEEPRRHVKVKRFRVGQPIVDTELRFLSKGDIFWYEYRGRPARLPEELSGFKVTNSKGVYLVATSAPIWARERDGKKKFVGIKFRDATETEIRLIAHSQVGDLS